MQTVFLRVCCALCATLLIAPPSVAWAGEAAEGVVASVDAEEVILTLGREQGVPPGATVQVLRRIEVKHPLTGELLEDRFPIGALELDEVGSLLSIARAFSGLEHPIKEGDYVVFVAPTRTKVAKEDSRTSEQPERDPERATLDGVFDVTLGKGLAERRAIWKGYLKANPNVPWAEQVMGEVVWLEELEAELALSESKVAALQDAAAEQALEEEAREAELVARHAAPEEVEEGEPAHVVISIAETGRVELVRVWVRALDESGYRPITASPYGDLSWRADLSAVTERIERHFYFIDAVLEDGTLRAVAGSADAPMKLDRVERETESVDETRRSRARAVFDYVDFWAGESADNYLRFESDYRYVIDASFLHSFMVGVGYFEGIGGLLEAIEADKSAARERTLVFGRLGVLFEFHELFGMGLFLSLGNTQVDPDTPSSGMFGFSTEARIGELDATRLLLGVAFTENIGNEYWLEVAIEEVENVPFTATVLVTNLPVGEDHGVSLLAGAGYRFVDMLTISLRAGWNARTINHVGFTLGSSLSLDW